MTKINVNIDSLKAPTVFEAVVAEVPGVKYEKFCVDQVQYLKFEDSGQIIIVPHFKKDGRVVNCP
jgi:hypothetical protein